MKLLQNVISIPFIRADPKIDIRPPQGAAHTTLEEFESVALILRLGLPSTLIRHENGAFRKRSSNRRNLKTLAFHSRVDRKHFENGAS